jgi:shikimate kinase
VGLCGVRAARREPVASLALIGFMGAGKSHVGMLVAHRLRVPFVDTDALIVEQLGPIEAVFAEQGEEYFRAVERGLAVAALDRACSMSSVVALGGGAIMDEHVRRALAALEHVVWLTAPVEVLLARCGGGAGVADGEGAVRPLACDEHEFRRLHAQRRALYEHAATAIVENDGVRPLDEVVVALAALATGGQGGRTSRLSETSPEAGEGRGTCDD